MTSKNNKETVRALLAQHGLKPSKAELEQFTKAYAQARQRADRLYTMPEVRYEDPALSFDPRR